jgi:hypothetical protein
VPIESIRRGFSGDSFSFKTPFHLNLIHGIFKNICCFVDARSANTSRE